MRESPDLIGQTLTHYRIAEKLGAGGMGEVYRAADTKLGRHVAIKVLPEELTENPQSLARFDREARALAALDHPKIAAIYSFEAADLEVPGEDTPRSVHFLVMQLVEGETLAERLTRGRIPLDDSIAISIQIAHALESAHGKGIIHRDLKPANVMVDAEGNVKVLDFGLAKALEPQGGDVELSGLPGTRNGYMSPDSPNSSALSMSPTLTAQMTQPGMLLGTAGYMSPEQARGKKADRRSDIWAFGCVLYEMLTGTRTFGGDTVSDRLARILEREPEWANLPDSTPASIRRVIRRCLTKDPSRRFHDMADVRLELEEAQEEEPPMALTQRRPVWRDAIPWVVAALAVGLAGWGLYEAKEESASESITRFVIPSAPLAIRGQPSGYQVAISPDGSMLAYVVGEGYVGQLYLRRLDSTQSVALEGAEAVSGPFFSPDAAWVGYREGRELRRVSVEGGKSWKICDIGWFSGATWGPDGNIVYADGLSYGLWRVPWEGGESVPLTKAKRDGAEGFHVSPQFLPGGDTVLFNVIDGAGVAVKVATINLATGDRHDVLETDGFVARYLASGHLTYGLDGSLMVVPYDVESRKITGRPKEVLDDLLMGFPMAISLAHLGVSDTGTLVYISGPMIASGARVVAVNREGKMEPPIQSAERIFGPRYSPDGRQIAMAAQMPGSPVQVWVRNLDRGTFTRLTPEEEGWWPLWAPDGDRIFYPSRPDSLIPPNLAWVDADGSAPRELLTEGELGKQPTSWSPDGRTLIYHRNDHPETGWDVMAINLDNPEPQMLLGSRYNEMLGSLSPDGHWLAYVSDESGQLEVYVRSYPDLERKWQISTDGGLEPAWSVDDRELFYRNEEGNRMMVVPITAEPQFSPGRPELLFEGEFAPSPWFGRNFDVAADGQKFLMVEYALPDDLGGEVKVVVNWFDELDRIAPVQ